MAKFYDCFLYNDEREVLDVRLELLADIVDTFVVVVAGETFTGLPKSVQFPSDSPVVSQYASKLRLIHLERLEGKTAWERESFSRDAMARGLSDAVPGDVVMVSDVDELPRPDTLRHVKQAGLAAGPIVLVQDYFNFKFNYQLVQGLQAVWAGPVLCDAGQFPGAQALRDRRWRLMDHAHTTYRNAGWHFSYLSRTEDVANKLKSFSHQEADVQQRQVEISALIAKREGFHDHLHPGSVWAVRPLEALASAELVALIDRYPELVAAGCPDDPEDVDWRKKDSIRTIYNHERGKVLRWCGWRELTEELYRRLRKRVSQ